MNENACQNPAKTTEIPSKAWLCAEKYDQVLLAYLVCVWHIFPPKARRILASFFNNAVVRIRLAEESNRAGNCFRVISRQTLDSFVYDTCTNPETGIAPLKPSAKADAVVFFNQDWARFTISRALRRILFFCGQRNELFLYHTLFADLEQTLYQAQEQKTMREMYHASERVRNLSPTARSGVAADHFSSRLVMEEWQQLHRYCRPHRPRSGNGYPARPAYRGHEGILARIARRPHTDTGKTYREIVHDPKSTVEILQKHGIHQGSGISALYIIKRSNELCLPAAELLKNDDMDTKLSKRSSRAFSGSEQQWLESPLSDWPTAPKINAA